MLLLIMIMLSISNFDFDVIVFVVFCNNVDCIEFSYYYCYWWWCCSTPNLMLMLMKLSVIDFDILNVLLLFDCLSFLFCCFHCSDHDAVVAIVLHFRFLLLLLLLAKQLIKSERYRTLHLTFCYCCRCRCHIIIVAVVLHFQFWWFCSFCCLRQNCYNLTIPSIAYPFVVTIIMTNIINNIFFSNLLSFYDDKPHWIPCVINCYFCYWYYYFALLSDPN